MMIILAKMLFDDDENDADRLQRAFQLPRVIMWGLSLYCSVSQRCCTEEQRINDSTATLTITTSAANKCNE